MALKRALHKPITAEEAETLTQDEMTWLRTWNRQGEIPADAVGGVAESESDDDDESSEDEVGYDDYTVAELRDMLVERGLPKSGDKADLIERLEDDDNAE